MNKRFIRYGCKRKLVVIFFLFSAVVLTMVVYMYFHWQECKQEADSLIERVSLYEKEVYVAAKKLPKGTILTEEILDRQIRYSDYTQESFMTEADFGKALAMDVTEGTYIMDFMISDVEKNTREFFLESVEIPGHIQEGDRVDIRIRYGNAEEYIVLADKIIFNSPEENGMVLHLTEEELLLISSAITDAEVYKKVKLYVVEYPEYAYMEKSRITYIANRDVLFLLGREKTEGESRTALEQRLLQNKQ